MQRVFVITDQKSFMGQKHRRNTNDRIHGGRLRLRLSKEPLHARLGKSNRDIIRRFGNYVLVKEIARGGMGVVYLARDLRGKLGAKRFVALKVILSGQFASRVEQRRFQEEIRAIRRLDHPNIIRIYDFGENEGLPFYSMELLEGDTV